MYLIKSFNNNIALVEDVSGLEWVVIGTGVGFNQKKGDLIDASIITKKFAAEQDQARQPFIELFDKIPVSVFETTLELIRQAESIIDVRLSEHLFLALADHIHYAIQRTLDGIDYRTADPLELKRLYPKELEAAKEALRIIFKNLDVLLPKSEESFLTYHFVNAQSPQQPMNATIKMTDAIKQVIAIIEFHYNLTLNEETFHFARLLTHLRYFVLRQLHDDSVDDKELDSELYQFVQEKYGMAFECAEKISRVLNKQYGWKLSKSEKLYLTLHIWRLLY